MNLVDEENNLSFRFHHFVDDRLKPLLKLPLVLGTRNERSHIERVELLAAEVLRHVTPHNTMCQPLGDGRLAGSRLPDKDWIVFCAPAQDLQYTTYLLVAADHRVELPAAGPLNQVYRILSQCLVGILRSLAGYLLPLAQLLNGFLHFSRCDAGIAHHAGSVVVLLHQGQQQMFNGDKLITHLAGKIRRLLKHRVGLPAQHGVTTRYARIGFNLAVDHPLHIRCVHAQLLKQEAGHILTHQHHPFQQVSRFNHLLVISLRNLDRLLYRLLRLYCKIVEVHIALFLYRNHCNLISCSKIILSYQQRTNA